VACFNTGRGRDAAALPIGVAAVPARCTRISTPQRCKTWHRTPPHPRVAGRRGLHCGQYLRPMRALWRWRTTSAPSIAARAAYLTRIKPGMTHLLPAMACAGVEGRVPHLRSYGTVYFRATCTSRALFPLPHNCAALCLLTAPPPAPSARFRRAARDATHRTRHHTPPRTTARATHPRGARLPQAGGRGWGETTGAWVWDS